MKLYIIAGEASGDRHGASLISALKQKQGNLSIRAWGGKLMESAGAELVKDYKDLAFMGFVEVVKNLSTIRTNFKFCKQDIMQFQPAAVILIDYPGFNLRMAKWLSKKGIKVIYYISPQLWAWHSSRVKKIKKYVDRMITILPFEPGFYQSHGLEVDYVGHPMVDQIADFKANSDFKKLNDFSDKPMIVLQPGSRQQEVDNMLPIMAEATRQKELSDYQFVVAGVSSIDPGTYQSTGLKVVYDAHYELISIAEFAWVSSGTATLETALLGIPQVVCYKGNPYSFKLAKHLVKVPHISLVNLIAEQEIVEELIQDEFSAQRLVLSTYRLEVNKERIIQRYRDELKQKLGAGGASDKAADIILRVVSKV